MSVLTAPALDIIHNLQPKTILCLSYPDLIVPLQGIRELYPVTRSGGRPGLDVPYDIPHTTELFKLMGATVRYIDIEPNERGDEVVDLNEPQDFDKYDLVIDAGVTEHCFNVATAIMNAAQAVKDGGHILHVNPACAINHGFWNFNPTMYYDFYRQNAFPVNVWWIREDGIQEASPTQEGYCSKGVGLMCVAERLGDLPLRYPVQGKIEKERKQEFRTYVNTAPMSLFSNQPVLTIAGN